MSMDDNDGQMIFGGPWGPEVTPTFVLQVRKNPEKTSPRKPVPTWDRTRARGVTGAHAAAWRTAVDDMESYGVLYHQVLHTIPENIIVCYDIVPLQF